MVVRAGDSCSCPCERVGMTLPLAARIVGPSMVGTTCCNEDLSEVVTNEPVAPESRIAYLFWYVDGTKALALWFV